VRRADNLNAFLCRWSWNVRATASWKPSGPVQRLLYLYICNVKTICCPYVCVSLISPPSAVRPVTSPRFLVLIINQISYGAVKFSTCMFWYPRKDLCDYYRDGCLCKRVLLNNYCSPLYRHHHKMANQSYVVTKVRPCVFTNIENSSFIVVFRNL